MRWLWVLALAGCKFTPGALGDGDAAVAGDGSADAPKSGDASPDAPASTCLSGWLDGTIRFSTPSKIDAVTSTAVERDPFLSPNELSLYFYSERTGSSGGADVYVAKRASLTGTWGPVGKYSEVNSTSSESKLSMTRDGLYAVIATNRPSGGDSNIYNSRRTTTGDLWPAFDTLNLGAVNSSTAELDCFVTSDGLHLYVAESFSPQRITVASRATRTDNWGSLAVIAELDDGESNADPTLSLDERIIVFSSNRAAGANLGGSNMWYATRASATGTFGTTQLVPDVNGDTSDGDAWLSEDGCRLYFSSDRDNANGYEIYVATAQ